MIKKKKSNENPIFTATETASFLALDLGGDEKIWAFRLANWRRSSRKAPSPLPHVTAPDGSVGYQGTDLMAFIGAEQAKWLLVQEGRDAAQPACVAGAVAALDTEHPHVRLAVQVQHSMRFDCALDIRAARKLALALAKAIEQVAKVTDQEAAA